MMNGIRSLLVALAVVASSAAAAQNTPNFGGAMVPNGGGGSSGGAITCAQLPALTGDITTSAGSCATTMASTISGAKTFSTSVAIGAGSAITSSGPGGAMTASAYAAYTGPYLPLAGGTLTGQLTINLNAASAPTPATGTGVQLVGTDATVARYEADSFGAISAFTCRRADGTGASPTAVGNATQICAFNVHGYNGSAYVGPQASIQAITTQAWSVGANGLKLVFNTTPNASATLTTALTIDQDQSSTFAGNVVVSSHSFGLSGNISGPGILGTSGVRYKNVAATLTDTTSSGTVAAAYTDVWGGNTIAASSATTFTDYYTHFVSAPTAGTNVTFTRSWALGLSGNMSVSGSVGIGGALPASNALAVTGTSAFSGASSWTGVSASNTAAKLVLDTNTGFGIDTNGGINVIYSSVAKAQWNSANLIFGAAIGIGWVSGTTPVDGSRDLTLSRNAPGVLQFGTTTTNASGAWLAAKGTLTGGTLADQAQVLSITATQPTTPTGNQQAIVWTVTSAGSAAQDNTGFVLNYAAGYTGSNPTYGAIINNIAASTGIGLWAGNGNHGYYALAVSTTTGTNIAAKAVASGGNINVGLTAEAIVAKNSATNIGIAGRALNTGSSPTQVGGFFSLNQTTAPTVSAALIADVAAQTADIALWRAAGSTVASVNVTGGLTATLTNVATTSSVCYAPGTNGLLTYNSTVGTCTVSILAAKNVIGPLSPDEGYRMVMAMEPYRYTMKKDRPSYVAGEQIGFIADWVKDDRLVAHDPDGKIGGMRYEQYTAALTGAVQYLDQRVKRLEADNDNLRAQFSETRPARNQYGR